ncbi:MAG: hypothetical protein KDI71_22295 [Xanthomonadales bacterium]|nr:hypothetical protein [Xanthomonadales bacterium]
MSALNALRDEISTITQRGIGMPMAGMIFWLAFAGFGHAYPLKQASLYAFFATGAVFPLGYWLTRLLGGDLFAKGHELNKLGGIFNAVQFFYWPILIAIFSIRPELVPFVMAVLFGSHFLPYGWFYRAPGYSFLGIGLPLVATVLQLIWPERVFLSIPLAAAGIYLIAVAMVWAQNARDRAALGERAFVAVNQVSRDSGAFESDPYSAPEGSSGS